MSGYEEIHLKSERVATFLTRKGHLGKRITRHSLAAVLSTPEHVLSPQMVTGYWPLVEFYVTRIGKEKGKALYANRPIYKTGYAVAVTETPFIAMWSLAERERNVVTRIRKDNGPGTMLQSLTICGDRRIERQAQRQFDRGEDYLASVDRQADDLADLIAAIAESWSELEWITTT